MEEIRITGMGLVNRAGISPEEFWENLNGGKRFQEKAYPVEFRPDFPSSRLRRVNRYCRLALYAADMAWKEAEELGSEIDEFSRGTIFTTGYGSMEAQVEFCREVAKGGPDTCSPTVFTGMVPNSCVGTVCMFLRCKGASTMLMGGNHLEYSSLLLQNKSAKRILCGAVEEYSEELYKGMREEEAALGAEPAEGCVVFSMERTEEAFGYCAVLGTGSTGLTYFPVLHRIEYEDGVRKIEPLLIKFQDRKPQAVFGSAAGIYFDEIEKKAFDMVFPDRLIVNGVKQFTGETMGCGFSMNLAAAALCLKHGYIPETLAKGERFPVSRILVSGYDVAGNYMCAMLGR